MFDKFQRFESLMKPITHDSNICNHAYILILQNALVTINKNHASIFIRRARVLTVKSIIMQMISFYEIVI